MGSTTSSARPTGRMRLPSSGRVSEFCCRLGFQGGCLSACVALASAAEKKRKHKTSNESADVRHIGDPALVTGLDRCRDRSESAEELQNDPKF